MRHVQLPPRPPGLRAPAPYRRLAGAVLISGALLTSACGSSHPSASGASASASASAASTTASAAATVPATTAPATAASTVPASTAPASTAPTAGGTMAAGMTCAQKAPHAFVHITHVQAAASGALTVTGNPATLVCGGPDDFHFNVASSTETGHVVPGASIEVFPVSTMSPQPIQPGKLASYLATDSDTRIFLILGPLTAITSLQEQFHP